MRSTRGIKTLSLRIVSAFTAFGIITSFIFLNVSLSKNFIMKGNAAKKASLPKLKPGIPVDVPAIDLNEFRRPPNLSDTGAIASLNALNNSFLCSFLISFLAAGDVASDFLIASSCLLILFCALLNSKLSSATPPASSICFCNALREFFSKSSDFLASLLVSC